VILAGDVGATKILLEAGDIDEGRWKPFTARRYAIADFPNMAVVMEAFLKDWDAARPARAKLTAGAVGAAGPAEGNCVKMTHRPWIIDGDALGERFGIPRLRVVNDLAATASGIGMLSSRDFFTLQAGKAVEGAPQVVLGVGTGLGVAGLRPSSPLGDSKRTKQSDFEVLPGEGGHVGFSPGRVEAEDVASGHGIANIYRALSGKTLEPAQVCDLAFGKGEAVAVRTLDLFAECLGNIAGDQVLATMARGGVFLAGGVMGKIARDLNREKFGEAFCAKGAMSSFLMKIPVRAITNEKLAILGAARIAQGK
jgi:glucokinase